MFLAAHRHSDYAREFKEFMLVPRLHIHRSRHFMNERGHTRKTFRSRQALFRFSRILGYVRCAWRAAHYVISTSHEAEV
jgi:hypothetical protein